ncbi:MAG: 50S ribosomal protein L1 [Phycisphaeraceae bacterium]|nr:50S ribosomal protein L1 [Phycisphaeraceae bacterium]
MSTSPTTRKKARLPGGKRHRHNLEHQPTSPLAPADAIKALRKFKSPKFDQTVNVVVNLGIDPKQADQALRGSIAMPKGIGRSARVICFCGPDKVAAAKAAGAVEAGGEDLVAKVEGGWFDFQIAVASPDMMRVVSKLGKVLGPKGLMPSPKAGTVAPDVVSAVREYAAGKQEYRNDDGSNVACVVGKLSFSDEDLTENLNHFITIIHKIKPASAKGTYIKKCVISASMSPGIQVIA